MPVGGVLLSSLLRRGRRLLPPQLHLEESEEKMEEGDKSFNDKRTAETVAFLSPLKTSLHQHGADHRDKGDDVDNQNVETLESGSGRRSRGRRCCCICFALGCYGFLSVFFVVTVLCGLMLVRHKMGADVKSGLTGSQWREVLEKEANSYVAKEYRQHLIDGNLTAIEQLLLAESSAEASAPSVFNASFVSDVYTLVSYDDNYSEYLSTLGMPFFVVSFVLSLQETLIIQAPEDPDDAWLMRTDSGLPLSKRAKPIYLNNEFTMSYGLGNDGVLNTNCSLRSSNVLKCVSMEMEKDWHFESQIVFTPKGAIETKTFVTKDIKTSKYYLRMGFKIEESDDPQKVVDSWLNQLGLGSDDKDSGSGSGSPFSESTSDDWDWLDNADDSEFGDSQWID